ncbi:MAG: YcaO-like family protein, partial [Beijerinckiaceae bacterium]
MSDPHAGFEIDDLDPQRVAELASLSPECTPALTGLTARFERFFLLSSPASPGLTCIGGSARLTAGEEASAGASSISATGTALSLELAALSCLGETADLLSPLERQGDIASCMGAGPMLDGWLGQAASRAAGAFDCIEGFRCIDGAPALLPADLCLRRPSVRRAIEPVGPLSSGVAAGADTSSALLRAVLELVERDAAAMWWLGGRPGRECPTEGSSSVGASATLAALRRGDGRRMTSLIDITTELGVPVAAAVSRDRDGRDIAIGIAARLSLDEAATAAIL